jgi:hypothetical protein
MYFSLFCGRRSRAPELGLRRRESIVFATIAAALVIAGLIPQPIVESRLRASEAMMLERAEGVEEQP